MAVIFPWLKVHFPTTEMETSASTRDNWVVARLRMALIGQSIENASDTTKDFTMTLATSLWDRHFEHDPIDRDFAQVPLDHEPLVLDNLIGYWQARMFRDCGRGTFVANYAAAVELDKRACWPKPNAQQLLQLELKNGGDSLWWDPAKTPFVRIRIGRRAANHIDPWRCDMRYD